MTIAAIKSVRMISERYFFFRLNKKLAIKIDEGTKSISK